MSESVDSPGAPSHTSSRTAPTHDHEMDPEHPHGNLGSEHNHEEHHDEPEGFLGSLKSILPWSHGHSHGGEGVDPALASSDRGIWALKVSLFGLGATAILQVAVFAISGSAALLADTIHNFSDALTALPLWLAFSLGKRAATRRYTYGYGRAEDVAGVVIVLMIALSAGLAGYEAIQKLISAEPVRNLWWVAAASIIGFLGNEAVALFRIRVGKEIGSAALVADGQHARVDGLTSLGVLAGVIGVALGFPLADPIVGLLITVAILFIVRDAALTMWQRLMDAVDPEHVDNIEQEAARVAGVLDVHAVRVRWLGHRLQAELHIEVNEDLSTLESHGIVEEVRHRLFHAVPRLADVNVHVDPCGHSGVDPHRITAHHTEWGSR